VDRVVTRYTPRALIGGAIFNRIIPIRVDEVVSTCLARALIG